MGKAIISSGSKQYVTIKALSAAKTIPVSAIRGFIQDGMPHFRRARKIYIDPEEFDAWFYNSFRVSQQKEADDFDGIVNAILAA